MGTYRQFRPPPHLSAFVDAFWLYLPAEGATEAPELRVLPDGCIDLIAGLGLGRPGESVAPTSLEVCGPTDRHRLVGLPPAVAWAGARFRIGAAARLLDIHPPDLLRSQVPALDCSCGYAALLDRMAICPTPGRALEAMSSFLSTLADRARMGPNDDRTARAISMLGRPGGDARVSQVARTLEVSERTLHRDVRAAVGLSPKSLGRVLRFQRLLARLESGSFADLCSLALDTGYSDQAHMTREVAEFAGVTPTALGRSGHTKSLFE